MTGEHLPLLNHPDPTYDQEAIRENEVWNYAFYLSEMENDLAPIGWGAFIPRAIVELEQISKFGRLT